MAERQKSNLVEQAVSEKDEMSGSYNILFAPDSGQNPSLVRNRLELRRKLSNHPNAARVRRNV